MHDDPVPAPSKPPRLAYDCSVDKLGALPDPAVDRPGSRLARPHVGSVNITKAAEPHLHVLPAAFEDAVARSGCLVATSFAPHAVSEDAYAGEYAAAMEVLRSAAEDSTLGSK
jgi:hypothetical protein